jgi:hypothetical protein
MIIVLWVSFQLPVHYLENDHHDRMFPRTYKENPMIGGFSKSSVNASDIVNRHYQFSVYI